MLYFVSWSSNHLYVFLQPVAQALKAQTCSCCLLAADVIVCDKFSVFVGTASLSV